MSSADTRDRLSRMLTAPLADLGLDLEGVELSQAGKRRVLRVAVDKDGGVSMDEVADATRAVSELLDSSDVMGEQAWTLEVGSPGIDRPLTLPRHWRRNRTRLIQVTTDAGEKFTGRLLSSDEDSATLDVSGQQRTVALAEVGKAKVQIEFTRPEGLETLDDTGGADDADDTDDTDDTEKE